MKKRILAGMSLLFIPILLCGCLSIPIGDGDSIKVSKDGVSVQSEDGEETTIKADEDNGSFSIEGTNAEGEETGMSVHAGEEKPEDFPDAIPIPNEADITVGTDTTADDVRTLQVGYEVEGEDLDKYAEVYREYADESGYNVSLDADYGDTVQMVAEMEDEENITIMGTQYEDDNLIEVLISYSTSLK